MPTSFQQRPIPEVVDERCSQGSEDDIILECHRAACSLVDNNDEENQKRAGYSGHRGPSRDIQAFEESNSRASSPGQVGIADRSWTSHGGRHVTETVILQSPLGVPATAREYAFVVFVGTLLSFNSGFVNATCLAGFVAPSGRRVQVSGTTTPHTDAALGLASGDIERFRFQTCMILSFIFGSFIAGLLTPKASPYRIEPMYGPTFLIGAVFLGISSVLAALEQNEDYIFYMATAASGIQNGISSTYSANLIRSTGLTGTSTDIGLFLGQVIRGNVENTGKLVVLVILAISFYGGGCISFYFSREFTTLSLLFNSALFFLIGLLLIAFLVHELNISFKSAMLGTWQWQRAAEKLQDAFVDRNDIERSNRSMTDHQLDELFDRVDTDKNGSIDRDELYNALKETGVQITRHESNFMMKHADKDGDGVLSKQEWRDAVQGAYKSRRNRKESNVLFEGNRFPSFRHSTRSTSSRCSGS